MSELGSIYYYGEEGGVEKDIQKSFDWFMKAAEAGLASAQATIDAFYLGGMGIEEDYEKAFDWSMKAARQGDYKGRYNVAYCYKYGKGVAQNKDSAIFWVPVNESSNGL